MRPAILICLSLLIGLVTAAVSAPPYYARGSYYAGAGDVWAADAWNQMHDDGLHGDGAPNDGVYAVWVQSDQPPGRHDWKIANLDWTENYPHNATFPMSNAVLYTFDVGEWIHFRLDTNTRGDGWQPEANAVTCSHFSVPLSGTDFELMGSRPELGGWISGIPLVVEDGVWVARATILEPGPLSFKFRLIGTWDVCNLGIDYNMFIGDDFTFETVDPNVRLRFEFDPADGRGRATLDAPVLVDPTSWSVLKSLFD